MLDSDRTGDRSDLWLRASLFAVASAFLGRAIQISNGVTGPKLPITPFYWLLAAIIVSVTASLVWLPKIPHHPGKTIFIAIAGLCLLANYAQLGSQLCAIYLRIDSYDDYTPFLAGCAAAAVLSGIALVSEGWLRHAAFWLVLATFFFLGTWLIRTSPLPMIDVYIFQRDSATALANGQNPYAITFRDIYQGRSPWYGPGLSVGGILQFGYPYMPLSLLLTMPAYYLSPDVRYAQLAALVIAAALLAYSQSGLLSTAAALLLLSTPRIFFVLEQSWTEPFVVMLLAAAVFCAVRLPIALPWALGLLAASKQYMPAALFLSPLIQWQANPSPAGTSRAFWRGAALAAIVAAVVTLPLALWDLRAFWKSAVTLQINQPYRPDSLSLLAWYGLGQKDWQGPAWIAFVALGTMLLLALWRRQQGFGAFPAAIASCFLVFFALSKQAFANYYFLVIGAMSCALAGLARDTRCMPDPATTSR